jgi:ribosomal protein S18 acetylase RimI-like enzyme
MTLMKLRFLQLDPADARIAHFILLLEPSLAIETVQARLAEMFLGNYQCLGAFNGAELIGIAGISTRTHTFSGRVMYVENVVFSESARGAGAGEKLMAHIEMLAAKQDCRMITLDAYQKNTRAQAFYQRLGYDPRGVHFVKELMA